MLHDFIEVGEYGLALEEITGALAQHQTAITGQERNDMLALARQMQKRTPVFCARAAEAEILGNWHVRMVAR